MKKKKIIIPLLLIAIIVIGIIIAMSQTSTGSGVNVFGARTGNIHGTLDDHTYKNEFFGFEVTLPDEWTIYDEDQIKEANGYTDGDLDNSAVDQIISKNSCYFDELAGNDAGTSINVTVQKLSLFEAIIYDEDRIVNVASSGIESQMEVAGYKNVSTAIEDKYSFCGETRNSIKISMKKDDVRTIKREFIFKNGRYYCTVTVSGTDLDTVDEICGLFENLD